MPEDAGEEQIMRRGDPAAEAAALLFEARLIVETVALGLSRLRYQERHAPILESQLAALLKMD